MIPKLNKTYIILTLLLFTTEALIAAFIPSGFIRYTLGDYLIVILIYCFAKIFIKGHANIIAFGALAIAFFVEFLQLSGILDSLNLDNSYTIKLLLGSTFQLSDLVAYSLGALTIVIIEHTRHEQLKRSHF
ncbi:DUF2809 domain-containing protein [Seonamhaeicola sp.]|uniref:ribosomal maturation YjgA family protein n=1 Tax=Seonamhaeicola sp. TaxID=1912245 RepID=UPI00261CC1E6|nr:DUF2809 domain-containing protein [Seonamhaeicola sp.]